MRVNRCVWCRPPVAPLPVSGNEYWTAILHEDVSSAPGPQKSLQLSIDIDIEAQG